jgi:putative transposase
LPILGHKIKLYPTKEEEVYFMKACGVARFTYNWALARWIFLYNSGERKISANRLVKEFNAIRGTEFPWTYEVTKWACQRAIQNLEAAFKRFFEGTSKYPRFKKKGKCKYSFYVGVGKFKVSGKYLTIPLLKKPIKMATSLRFPQGKLLSVSITRDSCGEWSASILVDIPEKSFVYKHRCETQASVGVDMGITTLMTLSDGKSIPNPRTLKTHELKLKRLQRLMSRKVKGSRNREKARLKLAQMHRKIARTRHCALHRATSMLVRSYRDICLEDLNVSGMMKNHKLAKAIADASWREARRQLEYKSLLSGGTASFVDRFYASSKTCSSCGAKREGKLDLKIRSWVCPACNARHDRDHNAALNICSVALSERSTLKACGEGVSLMPLTGHEQSSSKQASKLPAKPKVRRK